VEGYLRMTREGDEVRREIIRGTEKSPRRLWDKSSSFRFVKEAEEGKQEQEQHKVSSEIIGSEKRESEDKPILSGISVSWLLERVSEVTLDGSEMPRGKARLS